MDCWMAPGCTTAKLLIEPDVDEKPRTTQRPCVPNAPPNGPSGMHASGLAPPKKAADQTSAPPRSAESYDHGQKGIATRTPASTESASSSSSRNSRCHGKNADPPCAADIHEPWVLLKKAASPLSYSRRHAEKSVTASVVVRSRTSLRTRSVPDVHRAKPSPKLKVAGVGDGVGGAVGGGVGDRKSVV